MHYVCRGSSDSTDIALDLEIMLMKHNANIFAEVNGRYALHEVFIKSAESKGVTAPAKDPIYFVIALTTESMNTPTRQRAPMRDFIK